jgi:hypothetical protein
MYRKKTKRNNPNNKNKKGKRTQTEKVHTLGNSVAETHLLELKKSKMPCDVQGCPSNTKGFCSNKCVKRSFTMGKISALTTLEKAITEQYIETTKTKSTEVLEERIKTLERKVAGMSRSSKYDKVVNAARQICEESSDNCFDIHDLTKSQDLLMIKESFVRQVFENIHREGKIFLVAKHENGIERWKFLEEPK